MRLKASPALKGFILTALKYTMKTKGLFSIQNQYLYQSYFTARFEYLCYGSKTLDVRI